MMYHTLISATMAVTLGLSTAALAGPDLRPKFGATSGTVRVSNIGDANAAGSWVTVDCAASGGGSCPDPAPAAAAPYMNPAFPDRVAIAVPALAAGQQHNHVIAFFDALACAPGSYTFTVCADAGSEIAEDSERNNCVSVKKTVRTRIKGVGGLKSNTGQD
jgi:hypothetical protein